MAAYVTCFLELSNEAADKVFTSTGSPLQRLENLIKTLKAGTPNRMGGFFIQSDDDTVLPEGSITVVAATVTEGDLVTFSFLGKAVALTAGVDFAIDTSSDVNQARFLFEAIANHPNISPLVKASVVDDVITLVGRSFYLDGSITLSTGNAVAFTLSQIGADVAGVPGEPVVGPLGRGKTLSGQGG